MTPKWKLVFRLNEILILVIRGEKKKHLIFEVFIWCVRFASTKRSFLTSGCPKKNVFPVFFWSLYNVNNLRTASFSRNASAHGRSVAWRVTCYASVHDVSMPHPTPPHPTPVQRPDVLATWSA